MMYKGEIHTRSAGFAIRRQRHCKCRYSARWDYKSRRTARRFPNEQLFFCPFRAFLLLHLCPQGDALGWRIVTPSGRRGLAIPPFPLGGVGGRLFVQADMLSACMEYKDMLSDNGIANADIPHDGIANPVEQLALYKHSKPMPMNRAICRGYISPDFLWL